MILLWMMQLYLKNTYEGVQFSFFWKKILDDTLILYHEIMQKEITYHLFNKASNDLTYKLYNRLFKNVFEYNVILSMLEITKHKLI